MLAGASRGGRGGGAGRAAPADRRDGPGVRGAGAGSPVTGEELLAHCARNLARFKCPTAVEFVDALPHSAIGKVRKTQLRPGRPGGADRTARRYPMSSDARLTLITRPGCHLCEDAKAALDRVAAVTGDRGSSWTSTGDRGAGAPSTATGCRWCCSTARSTATGGSRRSGCCGT